MEVLAENKFQFSSGVCAAPMMRRLCRSCRKATMRRFSRFQSESRETLTLGKTGIAAAAVPAFVAADPRRCSFLTTAA